MLLNDGPLLPQRVLVVLCVCAGYFLARRWSPLTDRQTTLLLLLIVVFVRRLWGGLRLPLTGSPDAAYIQKTTTTYFWLDEKTICSTKHARGMQRAQPQWPVDNSLARLAVKVYTAPKHMRQHTAVEWWTDAPSIMQ